VARGQPADVDALGLGPKDQALARRVLRPLEARWHDGDENLVRGILDRWHAPDAAAGGMETAARLLQAGAELMRISARAEAWWFYLWEMESLLGLVSDEGGC
jgi:hypothetical protein